MRPHKRQSRRPKSPRTMLQTTYPGEVAKSALAHAVPNKVEAAYRRTDFLANRRELMRDWGQYCAGLALR